MFCLLQNETVESELPIIPPKVPPRKSRKFKIFNKILYYYTKDLKLI